MDVSDLMKSITSGMSGACCISELFFYQSDNGYSCFVSAKSLQAAKLKASKMSAFGVGGYSITTHEGAVYKRNFWSAGKHFGWKKWARID